MVEVLAADKPYFAVLLPPASLDTSYLGMVRINDSVSSLGDALREGDGGSVDRDATLEAYCSVGTIKDSVARFWDIFDSALPADMASDGGTFKCL